jgi:antitoxin component YwqK of YwqJK toxin-antitoxin module
VVQRDQYNRIVLEAELKGKADTLWSKVYTYHVQEPIENDAASLDTLNDIQVDANGDMSWGVEEDEGLTKVDTLNESERTIEIDSTKKSLSSYAKGKPNGNWKSWYSNGNPKTVYVYIKGMVDGEYTYYDSLGYVVRIETYKKGSLNGLTSDYDTTGNLLKTTEYKKTQRTGLVKVFLDGKQLVEQQSYKKDSLDGDWTSWHENGVLKVIRTYKKSQPVGNWIFNDETNAWMREEQYKKGLAHGVWSFYDSTGIKTFQYYTMGELIAEYNEAKWPNGQIKEIPAFKNGLPHDTWTGYWPDGSTRYTLEYKQGDKHGNELRYDSTGVLIFEVKFKKGLKDGSEKEYFVNGNLKRSARYKNGDLDGKTELFDSLGIKLETIAYKDSLRDGKTSQWWPNGEAHKRYTYELGILEGRYEEWDSLGTDIVKGYYVQGSRHKKWLYFDSEGRRNKYVFLDMDSTITDYQFKYYPNWQIKEEPEFNDFGLYDGKWKSFYEDGKTKKTYRYSENKKENIWLSYHQDGRRENYNFYNLDTLVTDYNFEYYDNLQIKEEPEFNDSGLYDGKWKSFYEDGKTKKTYRYSENKKENIWLSYHQDGRRENYNFYNLDTLVTDYNFEYYDNLQIKEEPGFNDRGLYDGKWEAFFENGVTWKTFYFADGLKDKVWTVYWDSTYVKQSETHYTNDQKNGDYLEWYIDEKPKVEGLYKEGIKDLLWTYWNEFGERRFEEWREGELFDSFEYEYYPNGQVKEEPSYENGVKHGDWVRYFSDGTIRGTSAYKEGLKDGLWIDYWRVEEVAWQGKYVADKREGNWKWFWLNQNLMSNVKYSGGEITFEECFHRQSSDTRDCSTVFNPGDMYYKK